MARVMRIMDICVVLYAYIRLHTFGTRCAAYFEWSSMRELLSHVRYDP